MSDFENEKNADYTPLYVENLKCESFRKEVTADFVLPDYMGDVKRVLKYIAEATPCNKIVSSEEASFLCIVTFRVTYLDSEDTLTEAVFTADAEFGQKFSSEIADADAEFTAGSLAVRLGGPRKISAKTLLSCEITAVEKRKICERAEYDGAEMLKKEIEIHTAEYLKIAEREYAEEIDRLEELMADEVEVVKSYASPFIDGVYKTDGGVNVSGYVDAFCIIRTDEEIKRLEKRIPIEEHIECEWKEGSAFVPKAHVTGVSVNLNNVNYDDACAVSVVMTMTAECLLAHHYNERVSVVKDAFYKRCKNDCRYRETEFSTLGDCVFDKASFTFSFDRSETPLRDVIEKDIVLKNPVYEISGGEITVFSEGELHLITRGNEPESCSSLKEKVELSKKYRIGACDKCKVSISTVPCDVSVSFDSEKIYVEAEIIVSVVIEKHGCEEILSDIYCEEISDNGEREVFVYYPEKEDTLWSVSKKYAVSPSDISERNPACTYDNGEQTNVFDIGKIIIANQ